MGCVCSNNVFQSAPKWRQDIFMALPLCRPVLLLLALSLAACEPAGPAPAAAGKKKPPASVEVMPVRTGEWQTSFATLGTLRANESLALRPEVAGRVTALGFQEGASVRRGQLMVQLDDSSARAELNQAEANRKLAEADLGRARSLVAPGLIAINEVERLQAQAAVARAAVDKARSALSKTRLLAPFDGRAGLRQFSPGELVQPGQALVTLVSLSPMKLDVSVPEREASSLRVGQTVTATIPALNNLKVSGQVQALEPALDGAARAQQVRVLVANPAGKLQPGLSAQVRFLQGAPRSVLLVPDQAIVPQGGRQVVYRLQGDDAVLTPVGVGERQDGLSEIVSGLKAGDVVVVSGQNKLPKPSQKVRAVPYSDAAPAAGR